MALRGGAGPVPVEPEGAAGRPDGAGGETSSAAGLQACFLDFLPSQLGAGVSLPGVVAARCGAKVILSDKAEAPSCLENCRRSCRANGVRDAVVLGLTWGDVSPDVLLLPKLDLVLGSDVFYDPEGRSERPRPYCSLSGVDGFHGNAEHPCPLPDFEDVVFTVAFLLRRNPKAQFWTTYQERRFGSAH